MVRGAYSGVMKFVHVLPAIACFALSISATRTAIAQTTLQGKQAAAPPEEIRAGHLRVPDPSLNPDRIRGNLLDLQQVDGTWQTELWLPAGEVSLVPIGAAITIERWQLEWNGVDGDSIGELQRKGLVRVDSLPATDGWSAIAPDRATVVLHRPAHLRLRVPMDHGGGDLAPHVVITDGGPWELVQHLSSSQRIAGQPLEVIAQVRGGDGLRMDEAQATFRWGSRKEAGTLRAGKDGRWRVAVPLEASGDVQVDVRMRFTDSEGVRWQRASRQFFDLDPVVFEAAGPVTWRSSEPGVSRLLLPLRGVAHGAHKAHVAAEVWATDARGTWQPAVWLARQVPLTDGMVEQPMTLELDHRWLERAGLSTPIELRNVRLQDPEGWNVWWQRERWSVAGVPLSLPAVAAGPLASRPTGVSFAMQGAASSPLPPQASDRTSSPSFGLMLVHGWCSGGGVWSPAQFDGPLLVHFDPDANRSYDEFAQLLGQLGAQNESFGVIGHSQGGNAALHLSTYYVSGLDNASGPRPIQSLASPYQGTPLASLGFFLCGTNNDMTPGGSTAWLANIPMAQRARVSYYTTSNSGGCLSVPYGGLFEQPRRRNHRAIARPTSRRQQHGATSPDGAIPPA